MQRCSSAAQKATQQDETNSGRRLDLSLHARGDIVSYFSPQLNISSPPEKKPQPWLHHLHVFLTLDFYLSDFSFLFPFHCENASLKNFSQEGRCVAKRQACVYGFPVTGSLQQVRDNLIQEGSDSDSLISLWKKHLAQGFFRVEMKLFPLQ